MGRRRFGASSARRGFTMFEVLLAGTMMIACVVIMAGISSQMSVGWAKAGSVTAAQLQGETAIARMLPQIRTARSYTLNNSGRITLQMPSYDASGNLIVPMTNGQVISYYLSDASGSTGVTGTILWRSVNGVPDSAWSMQGSKGQVVLDSGGLVFTAVDSSTVNVQVSVSSTTGVDLGKQTNTFSNQQDVLLRNYGL